MKRLIILALLTLSVATQVSAQLFMYNGDSQVIYIGGGNCSVCNNSAPVRNGCYEDYGYQEDYGYYEDYDYYGGYEQEQIQYNYQYQYNRSYGNCYPQPQPEPEVRYVDRYVDRIPDRYISYEDMWDIQIQFKADSYNIDDFIGNRANLYNVVQWMAAHPDAILILEAYADNRTPVVGNSMTEAKKRDHNTKLASNRGQAVGRILQEQYGIPASRLEIVNYGQDQQVYPGAIYRCNRCVLFKAR